MEEQRNISNMFTLYPPGNTPRPSVQGNENYAFDTIGEVDLVDEDDLANRRQSVMNTMTYIKTLQRLTKEVLPNINNYRDVRSVHGGVNQRPTLDELMDDDFKHADGDKNAEAKTDGEAVKFGWITGVLVRCMLNIWGPIMFLRLTMIVGRAGIIQSILIILLSACITVITGLSISAISTNGVVKGGGTYYLVSRSLGPQFGGSIGIIFAFANAVAVAMHTVGFAESMRDLLKSQDVSIIDGGLNDMRIIGCVTVVLLLAVVVIGMEWEQKAQVILLGILLVAIFDVFVGTFIPPDEEKKAKGFLGWQTHLFEENYNSDYRGESFFQSFSIFFPASTGILAGVNISGDLKDPSAAIPKGTLLSILITSATYIVFVLCAGGTVARDADGSIESLYNGTAYNCAHKSCEFGLQNHSQVMELIAGFGYLIYAGCFAATLSSALACLVSAPKVFQALCNDKIFPGLAWFGKGYGKNKEPIRSYVLAFGIAVAFILVAELNTIAPIISNFFMAAYCLINFACFHAALIKSPGFRPSFRFWNMWLSLLGSMLSLVVMFIMSWETALITFALCLALFLFLTYRQPEVNWGSSTQAANFTTALKAAHSLTLTEDHVKNYRPSVLLLTGQPSSRPALIDFCNHIIKGIGLMICGNVIPQHETAQQKNEQSRKAYNFLLERKVRAFYSILEEETLHRGTKSLIQVCGVGKLKPNMVMMGYLNDWQSRHAAEVYDYFYTIISSFEQSVAVGILRVENGLDYSSFTEDFDDISDHVAKLNDLNQVSAQLNGNAHLQTRNMSGDSEGDIELPRFVIQTVDESKDVQPKKEKRSPFFKNKKPKKETPAPVKKEVPKEITQAIDMFRSPNQAKGTIDVWWLYDDGGLTLLIPYILTTRKFWNNSELRIFSLANKDNELDQEQLNLCNLLTKFRINYSDVIVLPSVMKKPQESSVLEFNLFLKNVSREPTSEKGDQLCVTDAELDAMKYKTQRYIRIRELLLRHSRNASLVVMTLPMPKKNKVSPALYMAWLEALTKDLPPVLLVRGNQSSVLTFYS